MAKPNEGLFGELTEALEYVADLFDIEGGKKEEVFNGRSDQPVDARGESGKGKSDTRTVVNVYRTPTTKRKRGTDADPDPKAPGKTAGKRESSEGGNEE